MTARYCAVIPAWDASATIAGLVQSVAAHGLTVVVVDDGSTDGTRAAAEAAGAIVIRQPRNQGKGLALRAGFTYAIQQGFAGVVTMDSDGQHDPGDIAALLRAGEQTSLVIGNRLLPGHRMPSHRWWTNMVMSKVVSALARQQIPDSQCGFRFIRTDLLSTLPLRAKRYEIETELVLAAATRGVQVVSVPVRSIYAGETSRIRPMRDAIRFLIVVLRYFLSEQRRGGSSATTTVRRATRCADC